MRKCILIDVPCFYHPKKTLSERVLDRMLGRECEPEFCTLSIITYCPACGGIGDRQEWEPPKGLDPRMWQYRCRECRLIFYWLCSDDESLKASFQQAIEYLTG